MAYADYKPRRVDMYSVPNRKPQSRLWVWQYGEWLPVGGGQSPEDRRWWQEKGICTAYVHDRHHTPVQVPFKPTKEVVLNRMQLWGEP